MDFLKFIMEYFTTEGIFTFTRDGAEIFLQYFHFRPHYTVQLTLGNKILWRFCCGMEPTSMKKMLGETDDFERE
jgi:hypothetical protein